MPDVPVIDVVLGVCLGIGLSAACGFRIFVPPLLLGLALRGGVAPEGLAPAWMSSWPALVAFGAASALELGAYYVPWLDNALDTVASPVAVIAGVLLSAAVMTDLHPAVQWSLAIMAGGGAAAATQTTTVVTRGLSTAASGGVANFLVATAELVGSILLSIVAIVFAPLAIVMLGLVAVWMVRALRRRAASKTLAARA